MRKAIVVISCSVLMVASFGFLIYVPARQFLVGYIIAEREDALVELEERKKQLLLEREVLMRPERIQQKAHEWFQMRYSHE